jgi:hypothetical protein
MFIAMPPLNLKRRLVELALLSSTALALVLAGLVFLWMKQHAILLEQTRNIQ